jgi:hypothetical protein
MEVELRKGLIRAHRTGLDRSLTSPLRLLFLAPHGAPLPSRLALPAEALATLGHHSTLAAISPLNPSASLMQFSPIARTTIRAWWKDWPPVQMLGFLSC